MTRRVGSKGEVVIPKQLRDGLGIEPGKDVLFRRDDDHMSLPQAHPRPPLRGRFQGAGLSETFATERRADWSREQ